MEESLSKQHAVRPGQEVEYIELVRELHGSLARLAQMYKRRAANIDEAKVEINATAFPQLDFVRTRVSDALDTEEQMLQAIRRRIAQRLDEMGVLCELQ